MLWSICLASWNLSIFVKVAEWARDWGWTFLSPFPYLHLWAQQRFSNQLNHAGHAKCRLPNKSFLKIFTQVLQNCIITKLKLSKWQRPIPHHSPQHLWTCEGWKLDLDLLPGPFGPHDWPQQIKFLPSSDAWVTFLLTTHTQPNPQRLYPLLLLLYDKVLTMAV